MNVAELEERFSMPGVLAFEETATGLAVIHVTTPAAKATVYLHGAHLTDWQPAGQQPVLFLSAKSDFAEGKAIRGGVPVIFPWFGPRHDGKAGPSHGFARTETWELAFAALAGEEMHLTFTLAPNEASRALGFDHFRVAYQLVIGKTLTMQMTVANSPEAGAPLMFEQALHTYFAVANAETISVEGLDGTEFLDKTDGMKRKAQPAGPMTITAETDRVYLDTEATCLLNDPEGGRRIVVAKSGSKATVVWNPWSVLAAKMADMDPEGWRTMMCVETVNAGESAVTLAPGETHTMRAVVSVEGLG